MNGKTMDERVTDLEKLAESLAPLPSRMEAVEGRLGDVDMRLGTVEMRLGTVEVRLGTVESQIVQLRTEMRVEFSAVRGEMADGFATVRGDMAHGLATVRAELRADIAAQGVELTGHIHETKRAMRVPKSSGVSGSSARATRPNGKAHSDRSARPLNPTVNLVEDPPSGEHPAYDRTCQPPSIPCFKSKQGAGPNRPGGRRCRTTNFVASRSRSRPSAQDAGSARPGSGIAARSARTGITPSVSSASAARSTVPGRAA